MFGSTPFGSSAFGSNTSAFGTSAGKSFGSSGFGSGTSSLFGAKTTATTFGFGSTTQSQAGTGLFGTSTGTTGMFGSTTNAFGNATTPQSTAGFGAFGTSTGNTSGGLFGSTSTAGTSLFSGSQNAFGSANKNVFGASTNPSGSMFSTPASTGSSLFGQKPAQTTGSIFNPSATGGIFGGTSTGLGAGQNAAGTPHKFLPQTSQDTMMKGGISTSINTKHQCITLMKEYHMKSLEELRMEDYQLGRKGPQAAGTTAVGSSLFNGGSTFGTSTGGLQAGFGTGTFGSSAGTGLFGQQAQTAGTTSLFGAKTTGAGLFGTSTTFSTPSAFSNTASTGLFGSKPGGLFGTTTTQQGTGLFGSTPAFGTASSGTGLFGTSTFGQNAQQGSLFGAASQPSTGLFGATPAFGTATSGTGAGLFGTSTFGQAGQTSLFGAKSSATGLGSTFGATNTGSIFGNQNKPAFGLGTTNTFGASTGSTGLFGNPAGAGLFGNTPGSLGFGAASSLQRGLGSTLGNSFGTTLGNTGTSFLNMGQTNVAALQQQQQLQQQLQQQVLALTSSPFGDSPLFRNLTSRSKSDKSVAVSSQPRQRGLNTASHYRVSPRPSARVKPRPTGRNGFSQARLFDGLDDENEYGTTETFVPRRSIKKLVINKSNSQSPRSISSELTNSSQVNSRAKSDWASETHVDESDGASETHVRQESNTSADLQAEKFYSTPKAGGISGAEDNDTESPLLGVRRSKKGTTGSGSVVTEDADSESPVVGVSARFDVTTSELKSKPVEVVRDGSGDEQGPEPIDGDTLEKEAERGLGPRTCGVTLKRSEYYCNPSLAELDDMVSENGVVIVGDFVVGRDGFGMVKFFGECNVFGLNLDDIVYFRRREIEVYPESYPDKPPVGQGLNRKAEVTLYKVWPNDKTTRTPIKNPERLKQVGWLEKLENATARLGATFVDYQAETGTWIFTVDHFTRYGLKEVQIEMEDGTVSRRTLSSFVEDKDKEKQREMERIKREDAIAIKLRLEKMYDEDSSVMGTQDDSQMTDISQETFPELLETVEEDDPSSPASHHLATAMGVKSHRMQVMKASFFGEPEIEEHQSYSPIPSKGIYPASPSRAAGRYHKERKTDYQDYRNNSQWYSVPPPILLPSAIGSLSESSLKAVGIKTQPALVPLSQSVTANKHNLIADVGLTMGRSFRVGWGPAWTLVYSATVAPIAPASTNERFGMEIVRGSPLLSSQSSLNQRQSTCSSFAVSCARVNVSPSMPWDSDVSQSQLSERLQISLAHCERNGDDSSPCFSPASGVKALHEYAKVASKSKEALGSSSFQESAEMFSSVLDLVVALWGNLSAETDYGETDDDNMNTDDYDFGLERKEALSDWLSKTSQNTINQEIEEIKAKDNNHLRIIFSLLTGKQISAACQVAQANGDSRLSLLLAQASGNRNVRQWLLKQLDDWLEHKVDKFITKDRLKIYALLAGDMVWRGVKVCEDLDWKRAFSLHLWYHRPSSALLSDALASYEDSFKGRTSAGVYANEPRPSYLDDEEESQDDSDSEELMEHRSKTCRDTCYHLIKLFCKRSHRLDSTLAPASYTRHQLDVSLSWHLYQILQSVGYNHLSEYYASFLNTSYAAQLEALGLWQWAIFVLLHIKDPVRREQVVRNVLVRYCHLNDDQNYSQKESFLVDDLNVPERWIHEAKVVRARIENRPKEEAYHLLKSGHFNMSHEVILNRLASSALINEEYDSIKDLLVEIAPRGNSSLVNNWNTGGQVYLDYIKLCEEFLDIKSGLIVPNVYQLEKMQSEVASLCHRISQLPSATVTDKLCQSDMGTMCANFLKIIAKELVLQSEPSSVYTTRTSVLAPHIQKLPLPEDCCLTELRELTSTYVDELAVL